MAAATPTADTVDAESDEAEDALSEVLVHPDVLAGIMAQLGLRLGNLNAAVCTVRRRPLQARDRRFRPTKRALVFRARRQAWRHASLCAQEEQRVLRPSHSLGWGNEALGQFRSPSGIIMLPSGELCVADTNNHRLQVLSRAGEVRGVVGGGPGASAGEFQQPTGLACDGRFLCSAGRVCEPPP
jgi:hypothetical protein